MLVQLAMKASGERWVYLIYAQWVKYMHGMQRRSIYKMRMYKRMAANLLSKMFQLFFTYLAIKQVAQSKINNYELDTQ